MSEGKVKLPREVAEAIESLGDSKAAKKCLHDIPYMIRCVKDGLPDGSVFEPIVKFYLADNENKIAYFQALVNGYEVEETPEDRVLKMFKEACNGERSTTIGDYRKVWYEGRRMAIIDVLNALGHKVKGVNVNAKA